MTTRIAGAAVCVMVLSLSAVAAPQLAGGSRLSTPTTSAAPVAPFAPCDSLLGRLLRFFPDSVKHCKIAVFPFINNTGDPTIVGGTWLAEYYVKALARMDRFSVADRNKFRKTARGMEITARDQIDDGTATEVAQALGAQYMLVGTIATSPGGTQHVVEGRIIDVSSGIIVSGASIYTTPEELYYVENELLTRRTKTWIRPPFMRSFFCPGWGQFYRRRPVQGVLFFTAFWGGAAGTLYMGVTAFKAWDECNYHQATKVAALRDSLEYPRWVAEDNRLSTYRDKRFKYLGIAVGGTAAVWALNLTEVVIAGRRLNREYRLYYALDLSDGVGARVCMGF